jgi:predicted DsbA family dithiol-disulfide isomerase
MAKALAQIQTPYELQIHWRPFELNGQLPATGLPFKPYMLQKFGSEAQLEAMLAQMTQVGETEDIDFRFDLVGYAPNTFEAHRLLWWAATHNQQEALAEALFAAYFTQGQDVGNRDTLISIAAGVGLTEAEAFLQSTEGLREVRHEQQAYQRAGIRSVPAYILNEKYLIQGAQPPALFLETFEKVLAE